MIIDENELIEKFIDGDDVAYDFIINQAEDKEQIKVLENLKDLYVAVISDLSNKLNIDAYEEARNVLLKEKIGLSMYLIIEITELTTISA